MLILLRKIEGKSSDQAEAGPNSPSSSSFSSFLLSTFGLFFFLVRFAKNNSDFVYSLILASSLFFKIKLKIPITQCINVNRNIDNEPPPSKESAIGIKNPPKAPTNPTVPPT